MATLYSAAFAVWFCALSAAAAENNANGTARVHYLNFGDNRIPYLEAERHLLDAAFLIQRRENRLSEIRSGGDKWAAGTVSYTIRGPKSLEFTSRLRKIFRSIESSDISVRFRHQNRENVRDLNNRVLFINLLDWESIDEQLEDLKRGLRINSSLSFREIWKQSRSEDRCLTIKVHDASSELKYTQFALSIIGWDAPVKFGEEQQRCLTRNLLQIAGLGDDRTTYETASGTTRSELTIHDKAALYLLYREEIPPKPNFSQLLNALIRIRKAEFGTMSLEGNTSSE